MTNLLQHELLARGVPLELIVVEQLIGGDEVDCIANVSGELVLFELKDKEFSLGNAYSFGAKISIIQPDHPVICTTENVGNDAKEHFEQSRRARQQSGSHDPERASEISFIEGIDSMRDGLRALAGSIYRKDAATLLGQVLNASLPQPRAVIDKLDDLWGTPAGDEG